MRPSFKSRRALALLYLRQISAGLIIYQPIFIPFLLSRGLNMLDVAYLQTAYNVGVLLLDVPAGYLADRFGRKWALASANTALVIGTAMIAFGHSLAIFIVAELFYALAIALDAGTHSAYLYEWLRARGRESEYYRYDAFGTFFLLAIGAAGTLAAGYFAEKNLATPVLLTIVLTSIGIPAACLLPNLKAPKDSGSGKFGAVMHDGSKIGRITKQLLLTPGLRWALGLTIIWFWSRQYVNLVISQPYFKSIGLELRHVGMLYSALTLTSGCIALLSRRFIQRPDLRAITLIGLFAIPLSFGIMGFTPSLGGLSGFFLFALPYALCTAVTNTLLNRQFDEHQNRATFLSIVDFFVRIFACVLALTLGWILARFGAARALQAAMLVTGTLAIVLAPGALRYARANNS